MLKSMLAAIAAAMLGACASFPMPLAMSGPPMSFDDGAPVEALVLNWSARSDPVVTRALNRREFDRAIWRRPDQRPLYATAADRFRRHLRRRWRFKPNKLSAHATISRRRLIVVRVPSPG